MIIEDFKIIEDKIILNFEHKYIYIFGVEDLLKQTGTLFDHSICLKLDRFGILNDEGIYKIASIDVFLFQ